MHGGCGAIDKNGVAWGDTPGHQFRLVEYLTEGGHLTFLGRKHNWFVFWNYKGIYILKLDYGEDDHVRLLVVFCPWCNMFFSKTGTRVDIKLINSRLYTAASAHWAHLFFEILRTPNASLTVDYMSLDQPIGGNILFAIAAVQVPLMYMGHISSKAGALVAKNLIDVEVNHFSRTGLLRRAGKNRDDQFLLAEATRRDIKRGCETSIQRDNFKNYSLLCKCLNGTNEAELLDYIIAGLREDRKKGTSDVQHHDKTLASFLKYAKKMKLFNDLSLLDRLSNRYQDQPRQNAGNSDNHNASFYGDMPVVERQIQEAVDTGNVITIQAEGSCG